MKRLNTHPKTLFSKHKQHAKVPSAYYMGLLNSSVAMIGTNEQGIINFFNFGAQTLLGYSAQEVVDRWSPKKFHLAPELDEYEEILRSEYGKNDSFASLHTRAIQNGSDEQIWTYLRKDGSRFVGRTTLTPIYNIHDRFQGYLGVIIDITDEVETKKQLLEANQQLHAKNTYLESVLDAASGVSLITTNNAGIIQTFSKGAQEILGYTPEELIGKKTTLDLLAPEELRALSNKPNLNNEEGNLSFSKVAKYAKATNSQMWVLQKKTGEKVILKVKRGNLFSPEGDQIGILGLGIDVTQQITTEYELKKSEELYRTFANNFPNGAVVIFNNDLRYLLVDGEGLAEVGLSKDNMEGRTIYEVFPPEVCAAIEPDYRGALAGKSTTSEVDFKNRTYRTYTLPVTNGEGKIVAGMVMTQNITDLKTAESQLRTLNNALEEKVSERTRELQVLIQSLESFSHTVAHDLKNPVNNIKALCGILQQREHLPKEQVNKFFKAIQDSADKMTHIINDLLLLAKTNDTDIERCQVDMQSIVEQAQKRLYALTKQHQPSIKVVTELPEAYAHPGWIEEVWANYLSNAIKYGGNPARIEIGATIKEKELEYWVQDFGEGISPKAQQKLFTPFERLHQTPNGHGLGLSIVQRIIQKLGGRTGVESTMGEGSRFYFTLPKIS